MTGSTHHFDRQQSSAVETVHPSKAHQSSSDENPDSDEFVVESHKREHTASEADSGTDDIEQQQEDRVLLTTPVHDDDYEDQLSSRSSISHYDEGYSENVNQTKIQQITRDLEVAARIPDRVKKDFCSNTAVAFHAEFARLIAIPLSRRHGVRYCLFAKGDLGESLAYVGFSYAKVENAKAQFKCPNPYCQHGWTSARARILFFTSEPQLGIVELEILGQNCQECGAYANALWYIDEVCRVMKYLAGEIFNSYFPDMFGYVNLEHKKQEDGTIESARDSRHNLNQRKGIMKAKHRTEFCEACRRGVCFA